MSQFPEWFASSLLRNSMSLIVAALIVATCVKWMRLRSPGGEQWAWLLVLAQGVMFVWLTVPIPHELLFETPQAPAVRPVPVEIVDPPRELNPKGVPLRLDVPAGGPFDERTRSMEVIVEPETETDLADMPAPPPGTPKGSFLNRLPRWSGIVCAVWLTGMALMLGTGDRRSERQGLAHSRLP